MLIPESKIEEIRTAANIVDIVSEVVNLRKRGRNFLGLCPFHNEKTSSFTVSEDKQIFHCFGCHIGGNVFKFLMEYEKISFVEAVQGVARRVGIEIEYEEQQGKEKQSEQEILYDINSVASKYFSDILLNKPEGETGRKYFQERKIKSQTMRTFNLGYAPPRRDAFIEFAKNRIDLDKALQLGLIGKNSDGRLYDKYSGRIIFPIFSPNGRVVGFGGRILEKNDNAAKYLNSPESVIYYKGKTLYGLSHSKDEIRRLNKVIMVEGYMDLISLFQAGVKNVVAVSGTALTEDQVILLSRYSKNVVLLFDADNAGIKASMRSIEILLKKDFEIKIVALPKGEDPDSYVNTFGKDKFDDLVKQAVSFHEYQTAMYEAEGYFTDSARTAEAIRNLVKSLSLIGDDLKRNLYVKNISRKFGLRESLIEAELDKILLKETKQELSDQQKRQTKEIATAAKVKANSIPAEVVHLEKSIIKLLLEEKSEVIRFIFSHIQPDEFSVEINMKAATFIFEKFNENDSFELASLIDKIEDEQLKEYFLNMTLGKYSISSNWEKYYPGEDPIIVYMKESSDAVKKYKIMQIDKNIKEIEILLKTDTISSEDEKIEMMKSLKEFNEEKKRLNMEFV
jgi:DNA primase